MTGMDMRSWGLGICALGLVIGCSETSTDPVAASEPDGEMAPIVDASTPPSDAGPDPADAAPAPITAAEVRARHGDMFEAVRAHHDDPDLCVNGEWQQHFGDGGMYGPSFDLLYWVQTGDMKYYRRAIEALDHNRELVKASAADPAGSLDRVEVLSMALLSLIEAGLYLPDPSGYRQAADGLIEPLDFLAVGFGDYLELSQGEFAATTYGPTSLSAFLAIVHLEHALAYPDHEFEHHRDRGAEVLANIHSRVWDEEMGCFRFAPRDDRYMLYPNITMMLAYARAYQVTNDPIHLMRFEETYAGIQRLKAADGDHYHSPYSAEASGAVDEDYATLSSQNYLLMALVVAYQTTGEQRYLREVDTVLTWIEEHLFVDGRLMHHWVNHRVANETDDFPYCLGCNLQTLYILLMVETIMLSEAPAE